MNKKKTKAFVPPGKKETNGPAIDLGTRIKAVRKKLRLTQSEFANAIGLSGSFLSDIESGRSKPCYDFFLNVAEKFGVNLYYLILGTGAVIGNSQPRADLGDKEFGQAVESINELLWYVERSPMLRNTIFGWASKFIFENTTILSNEIEFLEKQKRKSH